MGGQESGTSCSQSSQDRVFLFSQRGKLRKQTNSGGNDTSSTNSLPDIFRLMYSEKVGHYLNRSLIYTIPGGQRVLFQQKVTWSITKPSW